MPFHEVYVAIGSIATALIAIAIFIQILLLTRQTSELKRTNELAHSPLIVPRQSQTDDSDIVAIYSIQNVGTASAINIDIMLKSSTDSQSIKIIALTAGQPFSMPTKIMGGSIPLITAKKGDTIEITGTCENVKREKIKIDDKFPVDEILPMVYEVKSKNS